MIRCSVNNDREEIISLWNEAFGDKRREIEFFLDNKFIPENTVVCEENGVIISQLFLLEGEMHINGTDYPSYYLYAACTSEEYRGKGIMGKMLEFSRNLASDRGVYFICLMPAEDSLFNYYSKFGYETFFRRKIITLNVDELKKLNLPQQNSSDFSFKTPERSRDGMFCNLNYFKWDRQSVDFAFEFNKVYGGNCIESCNGYLLYTADGAFVTVKENTFTQEILAKKLLNLCLENDFNVINLIIPEEVGFFDFSSEIKPNGMILCVKKEYKNIVDSCKIAYLGLTLD